MPRFAFGGYVVFLVLAFGLRSAIHYRRTGTTGFVGVSGRLGSVEWIAGALFVLAIVVGVAAPLTELAGFVQPWAALSGGAVHAIGIVCFIAGLAATLWAQLAMGESWRIGVDPSERTALVSQGPFQQVRNPIFSSMSLAGIGLGLLAPNVVSLLALCLLAIALEIQVRLVEEPYLVRTQGAAYLQYAARVGRFVPGLGRLSEARGPFGG